MASALSGTGASGRIVDGGGYSGGIWLGSTLQRHAGEYEGARNLAVANLFSGSSLAR